MYIYRSMRIESKGRQYFKKKEWSCLMYMHLYMPVYGVGPTNRA